MNAAVWREIWTTSDDSLSIKIDGDMYEDRKIERIRLMLASPEMYLALRESIWLIHNLMASADKNDLTDGVLERAELALSKARGETT